MARLILQGKISRRQHVGKYFVNLRVRQTTTSLSLGSGYAMQLCDISVVSQTRLHYRHFRHRFFSTEHVLTSISLTNIRLDFRPGNF